jgi:hypothetical protein
MDNEGCGRVPPNGERPEESQFSLCRAVSGLKQAG